jgi:hypothetical protein
MNQHTITTALHSIFGAGAALIWIHNLATITAGA